MNAVTALVLAFNVPPLKLTMPVPEPNVTALAVVTPPSRLRMPVVPAVALLETTMFPLVTVRLPPRTVTTPSPAAPLAIVTLPAVWL